jgi:hypothetical protein
LPYQLIARISHHVTSGYLETWKRSWKEIHSQVQGR